MRALPLGNGSPGLAGGYARRRMDVAGFVDTHLPAPPARVLEVGCGRGELALSIARSGRQVVAIDPHAPEGDIFRAVTLEEFTHPESFDAVVAIGSLHHIADLPRALDRVHELLAAGGRVLVREHAWERFDRPTAEWYVAKHATQQAGRSQAVEACLAHWRENHAELHTSEALRSELDHRFAERFFAWTPYLYGELGADTESEEQELIDQGAIHATGFLYVGERAG
jgi:SAM-dependent methyltransferase